MSTAPEQGTGTATDADVVSPAQQQAAHAYARALLEPDIADAAAADAIAAFRQALTQRGDLPDGAQSQAADETLLALVRLMTAVSVPDHSLPEDRRQAVWASIGASSHCTCRESAALLATRANGNIQPRESAALDEHLATCAFCRDLAVKTVAGEQAFRAALRPKGSGVPSLPRAAYAVIALLIALGVGIAAISTGGGGTRTVTRAVAAVPVQTQTPAADTLTSAAVTQTTPLRIKLTTKSTESAATQAKLEAHARAVALRRAAQKRAAAKRASAAKRAAAVKRASAAKRRASHSTAAVSAPSDNVTSSAASNTNTETPVSSPADDASAATPTSTPVESTPSAPVTASSQTSSASAAPVAPSTAAVSGQSSLPAESAPQKGIGSLSTAQ